MDIPQVKESDTPKGYNRYDDFYNNASILPNHRYFVGLYGENVFNTLKGMADGARSGNTLQKKIQQDAFDRFVKNHAHYVEKGADAGKAEVQLKWTVKNVVIPTIKTDITDTFTIDSIKSINYPLIKGKKTSGMLKLDIVENRDMSMYHFFNSLMNSFFNTQTLKPKSSFQKLGMYVGIMNGVELPNLNGGGGEREITDIYPLQLFEFNSIVPLGMDDLTASANLQGQKVEYSISFQAPNLFQSSFKTLADFNGLRDNSSDKTLGAMSNGNYKIDEPTKGSQPVYAFEVPRSSLV